MTNGKSNKPEPYPVEGWGTKEDPWFFPSARTSAEGVSMAHEFMSLKGPEYRLRRQALVDMDDQKILEYWETAVGTFWFRYAR